MKINFKQFMPEAFGAFAYFAVFVFTVFGITRAFHKGVGNGVASVFVFPYAWYCGVAVIWEPPQWKEEWDENTRIMAVALLASGEQTAENQVYIGQKTDDLHKWAMRIPKDKRFKLKTDAERFCRQYNDYVELALDSFLSGHPIEQYTNSISYPSEPSFGRVLEEAINEALNSNKAVYEALLKSQDKMEDLKLGRDIYFKTTKGRQELELKTIFTP
jgi:hypothetical protein